MLKIRYLIIALLCTVAQGAWATDYNVGSETDLKDAITNGASITLTADITLSNYVDIPSSKTVTIDLNGHTLDRGLSELTSYGIVIRVENGGTLTVKDSGTGGTITGGKLSDPERIAFQKATTAQQTLVEQLYGEWQKANSGTKDDGTTVKTDVTDSYTDEPARVRRR